MAPPAPARVSTKNCCPSAAERCSAMVRASTSAAPPAAKVLTMRTGRVGQSCACACAREAARSAVAQAKQAMARLTIRPFGRRTSRRGALSPSRDYLIWIGFVRAHPLDASIGLDRARTCPLEVPVAERGRPYVVRLVLRRCDCFCFPNSKNWVRSARIGFVPRSRRLGCSPKRCAELLAFIRAQRASELHLSNIHVVKQPHGVRLRCRRLRQVCLRAASRIKSPRIMFLFCSSPSKSFHARCARRAGSCGSEALEEDSDERAGDGKAHERRNRLAHGGASTPGFSREGSQRARASWAARKRMAQLQCPQECMADAVVGATGIEPVTPTMST